MDLRLIISFDENYEVTRVSYKDHERTWVRVPDAHTIIFGDNSAASRDRAKAFANAISTDDWKEYDGRRTRSERPESGDAALPPAEPSADRTSSVVRSSIVHPRFGRPQR